MELVSYETFYNLRENPFSLTPDPRFLFESEQHRDTIQAVCRGLETQKGVISIIGGVGTGKTTLCYTLLESLSSEFKTAFVLNPHLSPVSLLRTIAADLGIATDKMTQFFLMSAIGEFLLDSGEQGKGVVVIVDEAQRLSFPLLEQVRILSNFQSPSRKLLQIVLVGQTELEEKLLRHNLRQLNQRIGVRCYLRSLSHAETVRYIDHRLRLAGLSGDNPFTRSAMRKIWSYSTGTPRVINLLCDRALSIGCATKSHRINGSLVDKASESLSGKSRRSPVFSIRPSLAIPGLLVALTAGALFVLPQIGWIETERLFRSEPPPVDSSAHAASNAAVSEKPESEVTQSAGEDSNPLQKVLVKQLLDLWNVSSPAAGGMSRWPTTPDGALDLRLIAAIHGLDAASLTNPQWSDLKAIGLPMILEWNGDGQPNLLLRIEGNVALLLSANGEKIERTVENADSPNPRGAWIFWSNVDGWVPVPRREWTGRIVTLFAYRLHKLGHLDYPFPSTYDENFTAAVRSFQRSAGLDPDGILGPRTAMTLMRKVNSATTQLLAEKSHALTSRDDAQRASSAR